MSNLIERLIENWKAWGSPTNRDECVNEKLMAMDCKEAADEIERLRALIRSQSSANPSTSQEQP